MAETQSLGSSLPSMEEPGFGRELDSTELAEVSRTAIPRSRSPVGQLDNQPFVAAEVHFARERLPFAI